MAAPSMSEFRTVRANDVVALLELLWVAGCGSAVALLWLWPGSRLNDRNQTKCQ